MKPVYLSAKETRALVGGISDTALRRLWRYRDDTDFPRPIRLTPGVSGRLLWREDEVIAWLESRRESSPA